MSNKVTLVFGSYGNPELIKKTLYSFSLQTYKDFKAYIVDDNPSDDQSTIQKTREIVSSFEDPRFIYLKNDSNLGVPHVFRKWISLVQSEYFYICGAGDALVPDALEMMITFLDRNPKAAFVHGREIKPNGKEDLELFDNTGLKDAKLYLKYHLTAFTGSKVYSWSQCSAVFRTEQFRFWDLPIKSYHYWDFYFHCSILLLSKQCGYINSILNIRNDNSEGVTLSPFVSKIERLVQSLKFIDDNEMKLIHQGHSVLSYKIITKISLFYSAFRYKLSFRESCFCLNLIFRNSLLNPLAFTLTLLFHPVKYIVEFFVLIKRLR